jgi:hypothetical protein
MNGIAGQNPSHRDYYMKGKRALSERDYLPLWHSIAVVSIMIIAFFLFYKSFTDSGMIIHQDMTFPTTLSRNMSQYLHMWWEYGSAQNIFSVQRLFWGFPLLLVARIFNIPNNAYLFLMFWSTVCIAGISMYALTYHFLKRTKVGGRVTYAVFVGSVLAAVIYMYNPWSLNHLWGYFAYPPYALAPLIFLTSLKVFDSPTFSRIFLLAILLTLGTTGPICVVWVWLLVLSYALYYLVINRFRKSELMNAVKVLAPLTVIYILANATWILPYVNARIAGKPFVPNYNNLMSKRMLDGLSANNNTLWVILSFSLPLLAIASLLIFRKRLAGNRIIGYWSIMFVAAVLLATGSSSVLRPVYTYFALNATLGWVIRAPDRWLFYVPLFYSLMIGLLLTGLLEHKEASNPIAARGGEEVSQQVG